MGPVLVPFTGHQSFFWHVEKFFLKREPLQLLGWMFLRKAQSSWRLGAVLTVLFFPYLNHGGSLIGLSEYGNLILILYLMVLGPLENALGVESSGNPFAVMGVTRGLTRLIGLELPFYIAVIGLMIASNSADISTIMTEQSDGYNIFKYPLLFIAAFISFLGFMGKSPFDVVGAPQEVYSGPASEFSGKFLALALSQSAIFSFAKLLLMVNLFLGGADNLAELVLKTFIIFVAALLVGSVYARFTTVQSVEFLIRVPTALGLVGLAFI